MAVQDWVVVVTKETDLTDDSVNKVTGQRVYPAGFVVGKRVEMTLTHTPSGVVLTRVDNFAPYSAAALQRYVGDVMRAFETHTASAGFSAVGTVALPVPEGPSAADHALSAYLLAKELHARNAQLLEAAKEVKPESAGAFDQKLAESQAALERAAKALAAQIEAGAIVADAIAVKG